jgi:hypothetical protein
MIEILPALLVQFAVTAALSFVLGLELHGTRRMQEEGVGFGTTRTLTLIGAAGFVLWLLDGSPPRGVYVAGLLSLALWFAVYLARRDSLRPGARRAPSCRRSSPCWPTCSARWCSPSPAGWSPPWSLWPFSCWRRNR